MEAYLYNIPTLSNNDYIFSENVADILSFFDNVKLSDEDNNSILNKNLGEVLYTRFYLAHEGDFTSYNYLVLKHSEDTDPTYLRNPIFYRIKEIETDVNNYFFATCERDLILSDFIHLKNTNIIDAFIKRASLKRFKRLDENNLTFNLGDTVDGVNFYKSEGVNVPKILKDFENLEPSIYNQQVFNWIKNNVSGWLYVFLSARSYNVYNITNPQEVLQIDFTNFKYDPLLNIDSGFKVIALPIIKTNARFLIRIGENEYINLNEQSYSYFTNIVRDGVSNGGESYVYAKKVSNLFPFGFSAFSNFEINASGDLVVSSSNIANSYVLVDGDYISAVSIPFTAQGASYRQGIIWIDTKIKQNLKTEKTLQEITDYRKTFPASMLETEQPIDWKRDPNCWTSDFQSINISAPTGDKFAYDILKLNETELNILQTEVLTPETTKNYTRILPSAESLYSTEYGYNFLGLVTSINDTIVKVNDAYDNFIANNKNFWLQTAFKIGGEVIGGVTGGALAGQSARSMAGGIAGGLLSGATQLLNNHFQLDNLKNAPQSVSNASGNVFFNLSVNNNKYMLEYERALENDLINVANLHHRNGYLVEQYGDINDYLNLRKNFNYIEAELTINSINYSNLITNALTDLIRGGVRLINYNSDLTKIFKTENWEVI